MQMSGPMTSFHMLPPVHIATVVSPGLDTDNTAERVRDGADATWRHLFSGNGRAVRYLP